MWRITEQWLFFLIRWCPRIHSQREITTRTIQLERYEADTTSFCSPGAFKIKGTASGIYPIPLGHFLGNIYITQEVVGWLPGEYIYFPGSAWQKGGTNTPTSALPNYRQGEVPPAQFAGRDLTERWSRTPEPQVCDLFIPLKSTNTSGTSWEGCNPMTDATHVRIRPCTSTFLYLVFQRSFLATSFNNGLSEANSTCWQATCCPLTVYSSCSLMVQASGILGLTRCYPCAQSRRSIARISVGHQSMLFYALKLL